MSTQPCGCDPEFVSKDGHTGWLCQEHRNAQCHQSESEKLFMGHAAIEMPRQRHINSLTCESGEIETANESMPTIEKATPIGDSIGNAIPILESLKTYTQPSSRHRETAVPSAGVQNRWSSEANSGPCISTTTTRAGISVDFCVRDLIPDPGSSPTIQITLTLPPDISVHSKSVEFYQLLADIALLHSVKQRDYGTAHDPFANVRASAEWGIAPWVGALARLNDKVNRLQKFAREGNLANESAEDSMLDIAVYSLIALILFKEQR